MVFTRSKRHEENQQEPVPSPPPPLVEEAEVAEQRIPRAAAMSVLSEQLATFTRQGWVDVSDVVYDNVTRADFNIMIVRHILLAKKSYGR